MENRNVSTFKSVIRALDGILREVLAQQLRSFLEDREHLLDVRDGEGV